jgi:hypothetical protein
VKSFKEANHAPQITVKEGTNVSAKAGAILTLHVTSRDPDGNEVKLKVWPYPEAGSGKADATLSDGRIDVKIPATAKKGDTFHVVVEGTDTGSPALTRYRRVVITLI